MLLLGVMVGIADVVIIDHPDKRMRMTAAAIGMMLVCRRRLQDLGRRDLCAVCLLIPLANLLFLLWMALAPGNDGANEHGPAPAPNTWTTFLCACLALLSTAAMVGAVVVSARF